MDTNVQLLAGDRVSFTHRKDGERHEGTVERAFTNRHNQAVLTIRDVTRGNAYRSFRYADLDNVTKLA